MDSPVTSVRALASRNPDPSTATAHHAGGTPPSHFRNPWPSSAPITPLSIFRARFAGHPEKNFVPVPSGPDGSRSAELVRVRVPTWGRDRPDRLRATWLGHASFLVEMPATMTTTTTTRAKPTGPDDDGDGDGNGNGDGNGDDNDDDDVRGVRLLFDPVFADRTSPVTFAGPKRYTPTPCDVADLPAVDVVCVSHNHYDHLDLEAVRGLYDRRGRGGGGGGGGGARVHFLVPRNNAAWFRRHVCAPADVTELDWWEAVEVAVAGVGAVRVTCTPAQHGSGRGLGDQGAALWCSWAVETVGGSEGEETAPSSSSSSSGKRLYFAGDTGYQARGTPSPCPAFAQIGRTLGPFDLALLPIGLFSPPEFAGGVHCSPEQALSIHRDVRAKLSIGMHYGTVRGGVSQQYEDVRDPPRRWREAAEKEGLWAGGGVEGDGGAVDVSVNGLGLCDVGETVAV